MIEMGHPIHTFDLARIAEGRLNIRRALEGEQLRTLDGVDRRLLRDDIVVADPSGAVALAGVMGGESTEVSETTREVLVEAANWDPASVLATAPTRSPLRGFGPVRAGRGPQSVGGGRRRAAALARVTGRRPRPQKRCRRLPDPDRAATHRAPLGRGGQRSAPVSSTNRRRSADQARFEVATQDDERLEVLVRAAARCDQAGRPRRGGGQAPRI